MKKNITRYDLVTMVRSVGQKIADNADKYVPYEIDDLKEFDIWISFPTGKNLVETPEIQVSPTYRCSVIESVADTEKEVE